MSAELLVESRTDGVMVITLNRPSVRNAIDLATARQLAAALDELDAADDIAAAVLTGAGGTFSAGMDLKAFARGQRPIVDGRGFAGIVESPPAKPLIAAVEGYAVAGGFEIVLACDLIVASESARFGLPEVTRGLVAAGGGALRLPSRLPYHLAMELLLTGERIDAARAYAHGLVNRITEPGEALDEALALARQVAKNAPLAVAATKRVAVESADWSGSARFHEQRGIVEPVAASIDAHEGARAFAKKRAPRWRRA